VPVEGNNRHFFMIKIFFRKDEIGDFEEKKEGIK
jgi:hypothetical protein